MYDEDWGCGKRPDSIYKSASSSGTLGRTKLPWDLPAAMHVDARLAEAACGPQDALGVHTWYDTKSLARAARLS